MAEHAHCGDDDRTSNLSKRVRVMADGPVKQVPHEHRKERRQGNQPTGLRTTWRPGLDGAHLVVDLAEGFAVGGAHNMWKRCTEGFAATACAKQVTI
jgi:hypothetical protein